MKKKVAILHSQVPFVRGGAELMVESLQKNLRERDYDVEIIGLPYKWYPDKSLYDCMLAWRLLDLEESNGEKIDLVIGTKFPSYGVLHSNKVIWMIQQYRQVYDLFGGPYGLPDNLDGQTVRDRVLEFDKTAISEAKKVYTISKNVSERLLSFCDIESEPLYQPPPYVGRYKSGEPGDYICSVGRLDKLKRNDLLISALPYCKQDVKVKIAGKGPEMESLKELAVSLKVDDRVEFLGFVPDEDLFDLYANSRGVFFAPVDEDYGFITLEAFLSKKPVITCKDAGGVLEFVRDDINGYISASDAKALADSIDKLYDDKRVIRMGENGFESVKNITWDNVVEKLTENV